MLAFSEFLHAATGLGAGSIDEVQIPLAELFLWVQVLHSLDVPARRDLLFSLVSSLVLMAVAGVLSISLSSACTCWCGPPPRSPRSCSPTGASSALCPRSAAAPDRPTRTRRGRVGPPGRAWRRARGRASRRAPSSSCPRQAREGDRLPGRAAPRRAECRSPGGLATPRSATTTRRVLRTPGAAARDGLVRLLRVLQPASTPRYAAARTTRW